ncbi:MAG: dephospho-CoA kinase [Phycisphaerales bacterium]|nr:dephospho-CoA kinase [Phycisphaerales bacterium]
MLKVGITGGIGSGKSTVCQVFETLGIPVLYADGIAKMLMEQDPQLRAQIIALLGADAYKGNKLNRAYISQIVFADSERLHQLNALTHPPVIAYGEAWLQQQKSAYALKEAALFFESGSDKNVDLMIGVSAPLHLRIQRSMQREDISEQAVQERIAKQMEEPEKMSRCDYLIYNDDAHSIIEQVLELHQVLLQKE